MYKFLILHTHHQFQGNTWLAYYRAFREHAAAARLKTFNSSIFMLLVLVFDSLSPNQVGVCLLSSTGLGTTGSAWLLLAFATLLIAARFALPAIEPQSAPSTRNGLQPDPQALRPQHVENVIRCHLYANSVLFVPHRYCRFCLSIACFPALHSLV